jgi:hypothetical protein
LYAAFLFVRESPDDKFERLRAERNALATPDFAADDAYLLHVNFSGGVVVDSQSAIRDALLGELRKSLAPIGVNPDTGRHAGRDDLGTITADVAAKCQGYQGRSAASIGSIPESITVTLNVHSAGASSSWDGTRTASASLAPPSRVSDAGFYRVQRNHVNDLMKAMFSRINVRSRFERD